jgi:hypothetical protein
MEDLRKVRRAIRWLHANLEILKHMLRESVGRGVDPAVIEDYLQSLADGLWRVPENAQPDSRLVKFMEILQEHYQTSIIRLVDSLEHSCLSAEARERLARSLSKVVAPYRL